MGIYGDLLKLNKQPASPAESVKTTPPSERDKTIRGSGFTTGSQAEEDTQQYSRPVDQSVDQSTSQSTDQSTEQAIDMNGIGPVVARPLAFYVTQQVDAWLDEAVHYLRVQGLHKVDRSVIVNALLHDKMLYDKRNLKALRPKILAHMANKFMARTRSTE